MKPQSSLKQVSVIAVATVLGLSVIFWHNPTAAQNKNSKDTIPVREKKAKDFDDVLQELEQAKIEVEKSMKEIDWSKMEKELKASMQKMEVDMVKMKADMEKSIKEIDTEKIKIDMEKAMKEVDAAKIKADVQASIAKIDWEKMNKELQKVKEVDMAKIKSDMEKMKPEIEKSIQEAKKDIEKAKVEIKEYKTFVDDLEKDGLINKKEGYTIETKSDQLIINGKAQPAEVNNKYKTFIQKHKNITIKKTDDDLNIHKD